jgi:hypothetical protein
MEASRGMCGFVSDLHRAARIHRGCSLAQPAFSPEREALQARSCLSLKDLFFFFDEIVLKKVVVLVEQAGNCG